MSTNSFSGFRCLGVNWFQFKPGTVDQMRCPVCGAECTVERSVERKPSATTYMIAGIHDEFTCPRHGEDWHWDAQQYVIEIRRTKSKRVRELIFQDLLDFLASKGIEYEQE
ncbi:MAG: hypothetical protein GXY36_12830 [Chloroflexi bacterium]|nr:hypothetical protein [Chloroflexota bacterium]